MCTYSFNPHKDSSKFDTIIIPLLTDEGIEEAQRD